MLEASTTLWKPSRSWENDGNTSPSSYGSTYRKEKVEAISHHHNDIRGKHLLLNSSGEKNDGNISPSSHRSACCSERAEASSRHHDRTRAHHGRYNKSRYSQVHFDYKHVANHERKSWHKKTCHFCGLHNHVIVERWKTMATQRRMRRGKPSPQQGKKLVKQVWRKKTFCIHCDRSGDQRATCWRLHPEQHLRDEASVREPVETIIQQENVPQEYDSFTLISECWFF